jgi:hypothetical protein
MFRPDLGITVGKSNALRVGRMNKLMSGQANILQVGKCERRFDAARERQQRAKCCEVSRLK